MSSSCIATSVRCSKVKQIVFMVSCPSFLHIIVVSKLYPAAAIHEDDMYDMARFFMGRVRTGISKPIPDCDRYL